jgi:predicted RecA/RadA family phage recombinase
MASGETAVYDFPYPLPTDSVDVAGDIQALAERIETVLPTVFLPYADMQVTNDSGASITKGDPVYISGYSSITNKPNVTKSIASNINTFPVIGISQTTMSNGSDGIVIISGVFPDINTNSYSAGTKLYVGTSGGLTSTQPTSGSAVVAIVSHAATSGTLIVGSFKGNGTWGSLKAGLS